MIIKDENSIQGAVHKVRNAMGVGGQQKHYYNILWHGESLVKSCAKRYHG